MMSSKRHDLEDKSRLAPEQNQELVDQAVETLASINQRRDFERLFETAAKLTPIPLHYALRCYLQGPLLYDVSAPLMTTALTTTPVNSKLDVLHDTLDPLSLRDTYFFLDKILKEGLIVAVMSNVADDYGEESQKGRGVQCRVPDRSIIWPVIRYVLENPGECVNWFWLETALLSAEDHGTDREEAARLLVKYVREDSPEARIVKEMCPNALAILERLDVIQSSEESSQEVRYLAEFVRKAPALAALSLSDFAADTPGLAEVLINSLSYYWEVSGKLLFIGRTGRGMAAEALSRLGTQGKTSLPWLREIILSEWDDVTVHTPVRSDGAG